MWMIRRIFMMVTLVVRAMMMNVALICLFKSHP